MTLCGFRDPMHLVRMSWIPATSSTGRTAPPAMMPVPGDAGRRRTRPEPNTPITSCGIVPFASGTLKMFFFACSVPLRIASGTSLALPSPAPTCPFWSPTTTSAANENRRPPFTTLATRLMWTIRSTSSPTSSRLMATIVLLKLQARLAGAVGDRAHAAVVNEAVPVEHDDVDALGEELLGHRLADRLGPVLLGLAGELAGQALLEVGRRGQDLVGRVVHRLRVDVLGRPEHGQPRALRRTRNLLADPRLAIDSRGHLVVFQLPHRGHRRPSSLGGAGLPDLALDRLLDVLHALALVRLGGAERPHLRGRL